MIRRPTLLVAATTIAALSLVAVPRERAEAAIINTLRGFDETTLGWSGEVEASFSNSGGNTEVLALAGAARIQWQSDRDRVRLLGGISRLTNDGNTLAEDTTGHLRHNRQLTPWLYTLAFAQVQQNPFQRLASRTLLGLGARLDLVHRDNARVSVGLAHMVEFERIEDLGGSATSHRLSSFLVANAPLREGLEVEATVFAQPRWQDFNDLRAVASGALRVDLTKRLKLVVGASLQHDARPPEGVKETDWSTRTGLSFDL